MLAGGLVATIATIAAIAARGAISAVATISAGGTITALASIPAMASTIGTRATLGAVAAGTAIAITVTTASSASSSAAATSSFAARPRVLEVEELGGLVLALHLLGLGDLGLGIGCRRGLLLAVELVLLRQGDGGGPLRVDLGALVGAAGRRKLELRYLGALSLFGLLLQIFVQGHLVLIVIVVLFRFFLILGILILARITLLRSSFALTFVNRHLDFLVSDWFGEQVLIFSRLAPVALATTVLLVFHGTSACARLAVEMAALVPTSSGLILASLFRGWVGSLLLFSRLISPCILRFRRLSNLSLLRSSALLACGCGCGCGRWSRLLSVTTSGFALRRLLLLGLGCLLRLLLLLGLSGSRCGFLLRRSYLTRSAFITTSKQ